VIASQVRLSAQAARMHRADLEQWAGLTSAMSQAEMDLLLTRMPRGTEVVELDALDRTEQYRFNGEPVILHYPQPDDVVVRIYDHAGKINLRQIRRAFLRELLVKKLGEDADPVRVSELMSAWTDWTDLNNAAQPDGAEEDYYLSLDPPYKPRNGPIESVEEILLIKGFAELFADVDLDAAFTIYGEENDQVNLNLATVDAMRLLPGLDEESIEAIMAFRRDNEFRGPGDVARLIPAESMGPLRPWLGNTRVSLVYTILVYPRQTRPDENGVMQDVATTALGEIVEVALATTDRPRVHKINPYQRIPIRQPARVAFEE